jgi:small-conductance mechanosensitive channel
MSKIVPLLALLALAAALVAPATAAEDRKRGDKLQQLAEKARESCEKASESDAGKAHHKQCAKSLRRLVTALKRAEKSVQRMQARLEQVIAEKCSTTENAERCAKARERLERLEQIEAKLHELIAKLESRLKQSGEPGGQSDDASISAEEAEDVEELADELAAAGK